MRYGDRKIIPADPSRLLRKQLFAIFSWLALAAATGAAPAFAAGKCEIVIGSCHRPPLSTPDGTGIVDRLAIEAFGRIGRTACITPLPCERSLVSANDGITDGDILRIVGQVEGRYPNLHAVPETLYDLPMQAFAKRRDLTIRGFDDLKSLRVGFILGWKILEERVQARETLRVRGPEVLFPLLADDKVDTVIYEPITGIAQIRELGLAGIHPVEPPLLTTRQHIVLNRKHAALMEPLAEAIRRIKADGTYAKAFRDAGFEPPVAYR